MIKPSTLERYVRITVLLRTKTRKEVAKVEGMTVWAINKMIQRCSKQVRGDAEKIRIEARKEMAKRMDDISKERLFYHLSQFVPKLPPK